MLLLQIHNIMVCLDMLLDEVNGARALKLNGLCIYIGVCLMFIEKRLVYIILLF